MANFPIIGNPGLRVAGLSNCQLKPAFKLEDPSSVCIHPLGAVVPLAEEKSSFSM
jgi:hypothetical protein